MVLGVLTLVLLFVQQNLNYWVSSLASKCVVQQQAHNGKQTRVKTASTPKMNCSNHVGQGVEGSISHCQLHGYSAGQHAHHPEHSLVFWRECGHCDCSGSLTLHPEGMVSPRTGSLLRITLIRHALKRFITKHRKVTGENQEIANRKTEIIIQLLCFDSFVELNWKPWQLRQLRTNYFSP